MTEKVSPTMMQLQSRQKMKEGHKSLKRQIADITGEKRSAYQVMTEAMGHVSHNTPMSEILSGAAQDMSTQAAQDMLFGNSASNPIAALAEHQSRNAPYSGSGTQAYVHGDWQLQTILKETAIGKEIERYRVTHGPTGQKIEYTFRHPKVAQLVAAALNESNNTNDPRVGRILDYCRKEESIMLEAKQMVKHFKGLDPANTKRRGILRTQIEEKKLMLEGVRAKLGIL